MNNNLPYFIIIGTQKGGTTSLYEYLVQHPNVDPPVQKEIHFFDNSFNRGINWYKSCFPSNLKKGAITGEASPYYMFHPHSPLRIKHAIPEVKLIVLLRNPVYRAYSAYNMLFRGGIEKLTFEEAIAKEDSRLMDDIKSMHANPNYYGFNHQYFSYLSRGIYVDQLKRWFELFDKRNFLILKSELFFNNPGNIYSKVIHFLGLPYWQPEHFRIINKAIYNGTIKHETLHYLIEYFRPHNQRLYDFLGTDFAWEQDFKI